MARLTISELEIERNGDPFEVELDDGTVYVFSDPKGIQANSLISLETLPAVDQLRAVLGTRADQFLASPEVDGYVLEYVLDRYMKHYGLGSPPEGRGSRRSSKATASPSKRTSPRGVSR